MSESRLVIGNGNVGMIYSTTNPSTGSGVAANTGDLCWFNGLIYRKYAASATAWMPSSGTYVPTLTSAAGVTSVGSGQFSFFTQGNLLGVSGTLSLKPSTSVGQVAFYSSLPAFVVNNFVTSNWGGTSHPGSIASLVPPMNITNELGGIRILFSGSNLGHTSTNSWAFSSLGIMV